jgi:hypothetical protein
MVIAIAAVQGAVAHGESLGHGQCSGAGDELKGCIIIDANGCQKVIAETMADQPVVSGTGCKA